MTAGGLDTDKDASPPSEQKTRDKSLSTDALARLELLHGARFLLTVRNQASDEAAGEVLVKKLQVANIWTASEFVERIGRVPGLMDLASTPFMVRPHTRPPAHPLTRPPAHFQIRNANPKITIPKPLHPKPYTLKPEISNSKP